MKWLRSICKWSRQPATKNDVIGAHAFMVVVTIIGVLVISWWLS